MKRLGIIGGLGPETSCRFCLEINRRFRELTGCQPDIVLENLPVPLEEERKIIKGVLSEEMQRLLLSAVSRLQLAGADFIVIPCNTVHVFLDRLRSASAIPILSIIEVCADECERIRVSKAGLLASTTSIRTRLHTDELAARGISTIIPEADDQEEISELILKIIHNRTTRSDRVKVRRIIRSLKEHGAEVIILGCTDLPLFISEQDSDIPLIDTTAVLESAVVENLRSTCLPDIELILPSGHKAGR